MHMENISNPLKIYAIIPVKLFFHSLFKITDSFATDKITVIGDSHALVFNSRYMKMRFLRKKFDVCSVIAANVLGLAKPASPTKEDRLNEILRLKTATPSITHREMARKMRVSLRTMTRYQEVFSEKLNALTRDDKLIISLGEVDTGFVIWYRAEKYHVSVDKLFELAVTNYTNFISKAKFVKKLVVISAILPTVPNLGVVEGIRDETTVSQEERTELTIKFNRAVQEFCETEGIIYINLDKESLGPNGLIDQRLLRKNIIDVHYNNKEYSTMLKSHLKGLI